MYYCVKTTYNETRIEKMEIIPIDCAEKPEDSYDELEGLFYNWFNTLPEAEEYVKGCLKAKNIY